MPKLDKAGLRTELKSRGFDGFLDADLDRYIHWGYFDLARRLRIQEVESVPSFTLSAGGYYQPMGSLAQPLKAVRELVNVTAGAEVKLDPIDERTFWMDWAPNGFSVSGSSIQSGFQGKPMFYYILEHALILMPACDAAYTFATSGWDRVQEMEFEDSTYALPIEYEEALITAAIKQCHIRANELERANIAEARLNRIIEDIINEDAFITNERQDQVESGWDGW